MKKNLLITVLFILCGWLIFKLNGAQMVKPNNQYELVITQDHFTLMDGNREVATRKWESDKVLEDIILADNQ